MTEGSKCRGNKGNTSTVGEMIGKLHRNHPCGNEEMCKRGTMRRYKVEGGVSMRESSRGIGVVSDRGMGVLLKRWKAMESFLTRRYF